MSGAALTHFCFDGAAANFTASLPGRVQLLRAAVVVVFNDFDVRAWCSARTLLLRSFF